MEHTQSMIKDTEKPGNRKKNYTFHTYVGYQLFLKKKKKKMLVINSRNKAICLGKIISLICHFLLQ